MVTVDFNRLKIKPGFKILDIGCGSGRHTCAAYRLPDVFTVGADLKYDDLTEAAERLKLHDRLGEHGGGVWSLAAADVTDLPFKDDYFDLIICSEVLEHIPNHLQAIHETVRVLKPDADHQISARATGRNASAGPFRPLITQLQEGMYGSFGWKN